MLYGVFSLDCLRRIQADGKTFPAKTAHWLHWAASVTSASLYGPLLGLPCLDAHLFLIHEFVGPLDKLGDVAGGFLPEEAQSQPARIGGLAFLAHVFQLELEGILTDVLADKDEFVPANAEDVLAAESRCVRIALSLMGLLLVNMPENHSVMTALWRYGRTMRQH